MPKDEQAPSQTVAKGVTKDIQVVDISEANKYSSLAPSGRNDRRVPQLKAEG